MTRTRRRAGVTRVTTKRPLEPNDSSASASDPPRRRSLDPSMVSATAAPSSADAATQTKGDESAPQAVPDGGSTCRRIVVPRVLGLARVAHQRRVSASSRKRLPSIAAPQRELAHDAGVAPRHTCAATSA